MWRIWLLLALACTAAGQQASPPAPEPTLESLRERLAAIEDASSPEAERYREAITRLEAATASTAAADSFRAEATEAAGRLESVRTQLAAPGETARAEVGPDADLARVEQGRAQAAAELAAARQALAELESEMTRRQARRSQIPNLIAQAEQRLSELETALEASGESGNTDEGRRLVRLAERRELTALLEELEAELAAYEAQRDLLPARRDLAARRIDEAEQRLNAWQHLVNARRQAEARRTAEEAERQRREAAEQYPELAAYAAETQRLAESRTESDSIPRRLSRSAEQLAEVESSLAELRRRYLEVRQRIETSGLTRATGLMLRREYEALPDPGVLRRRAANAQRELERVEYTLYERQEERAGSDDISRMARELLGEAGVTEAGEELRSAAVDLARARRDVLAELENDAERYQEVLVELSEHTDRLARASQAYESLIRERILWVRSIASERGLRGDDLSEAVRWFVDASAWREAASKVRQDIGQRLLGTVVAVAVLTLLYAAARRSRRRLKDIAGLVSRFRTDRMSLTVEAAVLTVVASVPVPALLWWLGWVLRRPEEQAAVAMGVGAGMQQAAALLFPLLIVRRSLGSIGLADAHFRWPRPALKLLRRHLRWFVPVAIPASMVVNALDGHAGEAETASLGRLAFSLGMLAVTLFVLRTLRPKGAVVGELMRGRSGGWLDRLRFVWFPALFLLPVLLTVLAWLGYFYTALELERSLKISVGVAVALIAANGLLMRWLFLARRRVAVEDARRRREQLLAEATEKRPDEEGPTEGGQAPIDEDKLDLPAISQQTKQLFRTAIWVTAIAGLWAVWADVLPALRILDRVEIVPEVRVLDASGQTDIPLLEHRAGSGSPPVEPRPDEPAAEPTQATQPNAAVTLPGMPAERPSESGSGSDAPLSITLADIGLSLVILLATFVAFRNLPALIEIMVLQRLPLDAGSRYALSTVIRYLIAMVGIALALNAVNIAWSNIQWLAAALTFGLAFGLQEIFANFISGLIILAERPIRIGDTVTVGSVTGTVTRIRMRATTITDWDRKELVIPNKTFITGDVINWSLSDPMLRLIVPVGVSYDADVRRAESVLLAIADEAPNILKEPKPYVVFSRFGDSTLDFELRVFIPSVEQILVVRHDLHMRITEAFREAGIEIAYPQRDLHVRSIGDLRDLIVPRTGPEAAP